MRYIQTPVFKFSELSDKAKARAREWYRQGALDYEWYDAVYEDAATIADILGIDLRTRKYTFQNGTVKHNGTNIGFSGFWSQGDGAHFEGTYKYAKGAPKAIKKHAPKDAELLRIAEALQKIQSQYFYKLAATVKHRGHYQHENCTDILVYHTDDYRDVPEDDIIELLRDFMRWIYSQLEKEHDCLNSDEQVDEAIQANEYEFTENGKLI